MTFARFRVLMPLLGIMIFVSTAQAQFGYPGRYGRFGWGGWGNGYGMGVQDPASGYAMGLGQLARGQGQYLLDQAKATSINVDTKVKWNKELRRLKLIEEADRKRKAAVKADSKEIVNRERDVITGVTANRLLDQILEGNTEEVISYLNKTALNPSIIKDIPFEVSSEALSLSLHSMTSPDNVPNILKGENFALERDAVHRIVTKALEEDKSGKISVKTLDELEAAIKTLRAKFEKSAPKFSLDYEAADRQLRSATVLARMMREPEYQKLLSKLETYDGTTVGQLVAFMANFNLRFGPPTNDRQKEIYTQLTPILASVPVQDVNLTSPNVSPEESAKALSSAAQEFFDGISWRDLDLHAEDMRVGSGPSK
ncbi:MAG: hypothetical protein RJA81_1640 [Planctomycetota bacterium]